MKPGRKRERSVPTITPATAALSRRHPLSHPFSVPAPRFSTVSCHDTMPAARHNVICLFLLVEQRLTLTSTGKAGYATVFRGRPQGQFENRTGMGLRACNGAAVVAVRRLGLREDIVLRGASCSYGRLPVWECRVLLKWCLNVDLQHIQVSNIMHRARVGFPWL